MHCPLKSLQPKQSITDTPIDWVLCLARHSPMFKGVN